MLPSNKPNSRAGRWRHVALLAALCTSAAAAQAQHEERSFVLRAGTVIPVSPGGPQSFSPGVVIVRHGKIVAVGQDLPLPPDLAVIDWPDATVMPGLVAASSALVPAHKGDEAIAAGYRAIDSFRSHADLRSTLAGGVTTAHLSPGRHRVVTGQGAVVKLGGPTDQRVLADSADLTITLSESAYGPPGLLYYQTPSSSDVAIPMPTRQRPQSRIGVALALQEALVSLDVPEAAGRHRWWFSKLWQEHRPVRVQAQRCADAAAALQWLLDQQRLSYVVGGADADIVADWIRQAGVPLVFELGGGLRGRAGDIGSDPDALVRDVRALRQLDDVTLALATGPDAPALDLRLAAATGLRAELPGQRVIEAITRVPAEILGVSERVGSLAPGKDADVLVLSGHPLATSTHVHQVYIGGQLAFTAPQSSAVVVRGGTIWLGENERIEDGAILIEDGKIAAVGKSVPHPPFARLIDCGAESFITPGLIDAHGHLGLRGDKASTGPDHVLSKIIGVPDVSERRVARAGVTTVLLAPYSASGQGSQIAAVHTAGRTRAMRVVRDTAGVFFDVSEAHPAEIGGKLKARFEAAKKYLEKWQKYEKELAEWKEKRAKGEAVDTTPKTETEETEGKEDPLTGTWAATISGGPLPEPQTATMRLRLTGEDVEGRISVPGAPEEIKLVGTFDGTHLSAEFEVDTGGMGTPRIEADLVEEDKLVGKVEMAGLEIDFNAERTDKEAVEFKVTKRRTRGKDGRPLPPKTEEALEPLRAVLEGRIPALVRVSAPAQIAAVMQFMKEWETPYVLLDARGAREHAEALVEAGAGVVVPTEVIRWEMNEPYHQADDLQRHGVAVAFQSNAEDAARGLTDVGLFAVERGLGADAALAAMTIDAARMFKLDDLVGSIQPGRYGDIVVFSGHPFETGSYVKRVIVHGEAVR